MSFIKSVCLFSLVLCAATTNFAQIEPAATPVRTTSRPLLSVTLRQKFEKLSPDSPTTREHREEAFVNLLEAQKFILLGRRAGTQSALIGNVRLAKNSLLKAVECDPNMAEAYTALAEVTIIIPPNDIDDAIGLASIATGINKNNLGGHRILARLNTIKSNLNQRTLDSPHAELAVAEWREITRLDPKNAEAWAFLSEFFDRSGRQAEQIAALNKWINASPPEDTQFYQNIIGGQKLSSETALIKLGLALAKKGDIRGSVETLSRAIVENPDSVEAIETLDAALEAADERTAPAAIDMLRQRVVENRENVSLIGLLAKVLAKTGKIDDAALVLRGSAERLSTLDPSASAALSVSLGGLYSDSDRLTEAVSAYENAFSVRAPAAGTSNTDEREFARGLFEKLIRTYKLAYHVDDALKVIERARLFFGRDDLFADRQMISLYRESGKKTEALAAVRNVRSRFPDDYGFIRLEATVLTEMGKVDEGVTLVKNFLTKSHVTATDPPAAQKSPNVQGMSVYDKFSNYLFISNLYSEAGRGKDAAEAANQAYDLADGSDRRQIARLTLASAQQQSGDFAGAESTLRDLIKQTPGNPIALNNLGYFLLERNERIDEAIGLIQQALKIDPTNPSYLDSMGWAFYKQGKLVQAEKYIKDAARINSESATINEHLGDVYHKENKEDLARRAWQRALNVTGDAVEIARLKAKMGLPK